MKRDKQQATSNKELSSKQVLVVGLGKSGLAALRLLQKLGCNSLFAAELKSEEPQRRLAAQLESEGVAVELGPHRRSLLAGKELVVTSPGVVWDKPPLTWAREEGLPVISEIELASRYCRGKMVAVTGTNGKSTTVSLIHHLLKSAGRHSVLCGNIGEPFADNVLSVGAGDIVVLEISSFQLLGCTTFRPFLSVILNVTTNHLDWHPDFATYLEAKKRIFQRQGVSDLLALNVQDPTLKCLAVPSNGPRRLWFGWGEQARGVFAKGEWMVTTLRGKEEKLFPLSDIPLLGAHNTSNAAAAALAVFSLGLPAEAIRENLRSFRGLEHRLEEVARSGGVTFINDSKATTVESARQALLAIREPILLIAGGRDKGSDFTFLRETISQRVKKVFLIGEARPKIRKAFEGYVAIEEADGLEAAVEKAARQAKQGETVLLSPMCASFDLFENFEARGRAFKEAVYRLTEKQKRCVTSDSPSFSSS